jgi:type I restriction enzyme R subunit
VPEVVNLVFFKMVRSKTKFWQMLGRGTRLCPDLFGPGQHKTHFLVFDFCQNFEYFNQNPQAGEGALGASLSERLFIARVELIGQIDTAVEHSDLGDAASALLDLRGGLVGRLHEEVAGMRLDNFVVRPKRRQVEKYQDKRAWDRLSADDRNELTERVAGLPSAYQDDDLAAKQFDFLLLQTQLAVLRADPGFASLQTRIIGIAAQLEELANIPMVKPHLAYIAEVQTEEFWEDITLPMLEHLRRRLRLLVKLIEPKARKIVYSDFEDEVGEAVGVHLDRPLYGLDKGQFLLKVRHFLKQHEDHITIRRLRRNEPLTAQDLSELERIFIEESVATDEDLARIRDQGGLGLFIRSLVGLERDAVQQAFAEFLAGRTLTANQIEFMNLIIDQLTEQGTMEPGRLYESPFTDFSDQGVVGVFSMEDAKRVIGVLQEVRARAAA